MLTTWFGIQFLIIVGVPILTGFWLNRRLGLSWRLFFAGALAYASAWVVANFFFFLGAAGLLVSSIAQMGALYLIYRFQLKTVEMESEAIMVGIGQVGIELILSAILFFVLSFAQMAPLRNATDEAIIDLAARVDGIAKKDVEPSRVDELREQIDDYWSTPWFIPLLQAIQALTLLPIQAVLAIIALGALTQNTWRPLIGAMALHFLSRISPSYGLAFGGVITWLSLSLLFGGIALWFLIRLWPVVKVQTEKLREGQQA